MSGTFNIDAVLPADREFFTVRYLAKLWSSSVQHVNNLVESGELETVIDLKGAKATKSMIRIPRSSVIKFIGKRKR